MHLLHVFCSSTTQITTTKTQHRESWRNGEEVEDELTQRDRHEDQKILNPLVQHHSNNTIESLNQKENNGCSTIKRRGSIKEAKDMDVDNSIVFPSKDKEESKNIVKALHASDIEDQKVLNPSMLHHSNECITPLGAKNIVLARKHIT
ncbi:hypothetical protein RYX36_034116 [Vicia faba]